MCCVERVDTQVDRLRHRRSDRLACEPVVLDLDVNLPVPVADREQIMDGEFASQVPSNVRQKPTTVATPASSFPRSYANGINEFVSMASSPPAASAAARSP